MTRLGRARMPRDLWRLLQATGAVAEMTSSSLSCATTVIAITRRGTETQRMTNRRDVLGHPRGGVTGDCLRTGETMCNTKLIQRE